MHYVPNLTFALIPVPSYKVVHAPLDFVDDKEEIGTQICASGRESRLEVYEW